MQHVHGIIVIITANIAITRTSMDLSLCIQHHPFSQGWEGETDYLSSAEVIGPCFQVRESQSMKSWSWGICLPIFWFWPLWVCAEPDSFTADCLWLRPRTGVRVAKKERMMGSLGWRPEQTQWDVHLKDFLQDSLYQGWHFSLCVPASLFSTWRRNNHIIHVLHKRQSFSQCHP